MLKGIQLQYQGIRKYLETNKNNQTINESWQCYCLNIQKIVLEIFHLNLMIFDHLENSIPKSLKTMYQQIMTSLKIFLKNKPKNEEKEDTQNQYFRKGFDQVDQFIHNRPEILNNNEGRGDLYKFLMQNQQKQKNNEIFLKQIPIYNKQSSHKLKTMKSSTIEMLDIYRYPINQQINRPINNQQTQTQTNQKNIQELIHYYLSTNKNQNKYETFFNEMMLIYHQKIQNPTAIFTNLIKLIPSIELDLPFLKKISNKQKSSSNSYQNSKDQNIKVISNKNMKAGEVKKKQTVKKQTKTSNNHKKKDTKRNSIDNNYDIKNYLSVDKAKDILHSRQNMIERQTQQILKKSNDIDKQNSIQRQFQEVVKKYCGKNVDMSQRSSQYPSDKKLSIYSSSNKLAQDNQNGDCQQRKMNKLLQKQQNTLARNNNSIRQRNMIVETNQHSIGQLDLHSNINSSIKNDNQTPTFQNSTFNQESLENSDKCLDKKCLLDGMLSHNQKLSHFSKKQSQMPTIIISPEKSNNKTMKGNDKIDDDSAITDEITYQKDKTKDRQRKISNKDQTKFENSQNIYFNFTTNKVGYKQYGQLNETHEKYLPKIVQKNKKASPETNQFMKKAYENSPYTQSIVNYNKQTLSKNTSLPTFNYKSMHHTGKSNHNHEKMVNVSQHLKPIQSSKWKQTIIADEKHLLQHQTNLINEINELGQSKNVKSGQWIKLMNKIKNYELIHKSFCGEECIHLIKFNEFLKKNKSKLYLHRKQLKLNKKDIFLDER